MTIEQSSTPDDARDKLIEDLLKLPTLQGIWLLGYVNGYSSAMVSVAAGLGRKVAPDEAEKLAADYTRHIAANKVFLQQVSTLVDGYLNLAGINTSEGR